MHQFDEHHPEFEGFSAYFDAEILPKLSQEEDARLSAVSQIKALTLAFGIGGSVLILVFLSLLAQGGPTVIMALIFTFFSIGAMFFYVETQKRLDPVRAVSKINILDGITTFLGLSYSEEAAVVATLPAFVDLNLLPAKFDRSASGDLIEGTAHGRSFRVMTVKLEKRHESDGHDQWTTKFLGQIITIDFEQAFLGRTVVLRDKGVFNRKSKRDMKRVGLVDPVFEKIFEAYSTDQVEARYLLTPVFMQRLVDLENAFNGKRIRFGFSGGRLRIVVETNTVYGPGSMLKPLMLPARTQKVLDEIGAIFDVIDGVLKR